MTRALAWLCVLVVFPALAHDLWLVPPPRGDVGVPLEVEVSTGMDFPTSLVAIDPARLTVTAVGPDGARADVTLRQDGSNDTTWATFTPTSAGAWVVAAETAPKLLEMDAADFNDYLLHDGLPHVLAGRMDRGETDRDAAELYSKFVKAVVPVGGSTGGDAARTALGRTLELVPLDDPFGVSVGDTLRVRVVFRGEPVGRANVCWDHPGNGEDFTGQTWTDAGGVAVVPITKPGVTTLRLVHMTRPQTSGHEWESFWASYTFHAR